MTRWELLDSGTRGDVHWAQFRGTGGHAVVSLGGLIVIGRPNDTLVIQAEGTKETMNTAERFRDGIDVTALRRWLRDADTIWVTPSYSGVATKEEA